MNSSPKQVEREIDRIRYNADEAVRLANVATGNDDRAIVGALAALTDAVLLLAEQKAEMTL